MAKKLSGADVARMLSDADEKVAWGAVRIVELLGVWPQRLGQIMRAAEDAINDSRWQVADDLLAQAQTLINANAAHFKTWQAELHVVRGYSFARRDWNRAERELADAYILEPSNECIRRATARIQAMLGK